MGRRTNLNKGDRSSCKDHSGISLVGIVSKLFADINLWRLCSIRERRALGNQADFHRGQGCTEQILTL